MMIYLHVCQKLFVYIQPFYQFIYSIDTRYKIQDISFSNHGPFKGIKGTNIQRKNHNYIEYSYPMTYLSQHIKSNKQ